MPVPVSQVPPQVAEYLNDLEVRLSILELPLGPRPVFSSTTALMPAASAYINGVLRNTTLNILAHSDGANWIREDTGAII